MWIIFFVNLKHELSLTIIDQTALLLSDMSFPAACDVKAEHLYRSSVSQHLNQLRSGSSSIPWAVQWPNLNFWFYLHPAYKMCICPCSFLNLVFSIVMVKSKRGSKIQVVLFVEKIKIRKLQDEAEQWNRCLASSHGGMNSLHTEFCIFLMLKNN